MFYVQIKTTKLYSVNCKCQSNRNTNIYETRQNTI